MRRFVLKLIILTCIAFPASILMSPVRSQATQESETTKELERSFRAFLDDYWQEIRRRNRTYIESVHPKLPSEMHDFFFDLTLQMMNFSEEGVLERTIECQDFKVCKVVYPQPNDGWAAQRFILYEGDWRWLDQ